MTNATGSARKQLGGGAALGFILEVGAPQYFGISTPSG